MVCSLPHWMVYWLHCHPVYATRNWRTYLLETIQCGICVSGASIFIQCTDMKTVGYFMCMCTYKYQDTRVNIITNPTSSHPTPFYLLTVIALTVSIVSTIIALDSSTYSLARGSEGEKIYLYQMGSDLSLQLA